MVFAPPKKPIRKYSNIGFDIETYGEHNDFLFCSLFFDDNNYKVFMDKNEFLEWIISNSSFLDKKRIFAHNMQFDFLGSFGDTQYMKEFKLVQRGADFIMAKTYAYDNSLHCWSSKNHHQFTIQFLDTKNFHNVDLKTAGDIIGIPKLKTPTFIGEIPKNKEDWEYFIKYNINDSKVAKYLADYLQNSFNELGGEMKATIAASAMDLFRRKYLNRIIFTPSIKDIEDMYKCYYGGRTETYNRGYTTERLNYYDFNSLYPDVMKNNLFPIQNSLKKITIMKNDFIAEYEGFCYAELEYETNIKIPFLCTRYDDKLLFPKGKIKGCYTFLELRKAKELGYKIKLIKNAFYYLKSDNIFKDFVHDLYKKRMEYKQNKNPMELVTKIILNSLYGKFGQKLERNEIIHANALGKKELYESEQIGNSDYHRIKRKMEQSQITFINPIIAAYVTAHARLKLYNAITDIEDNVFYDDTDSIITTKNIANSSELGELKLECRIKEAYFVKPKFYAYITDENKEISKIKGIAAIKDFGAFEDILKNLKAKTMTFAKYKTAIIRDIPFNSKIEAEKVLSLEDNKRDWLGKKFSINDFADSKPLSI